MVSSCLVKTAGVVYKEASSATVKKAQELSGDLKTALIGALGGAGIGLMAHAITPKDKDEDRRKRILSHILSGAALGGLAGYGMSRLGSRINEMTPDDNPDWWQRNAPELSYSRAATAGGIGAGAYAGIKGVDALRGGFGMARLRTLDPAAARAIDLLRNATPDQIAGAAHDFPADISEGLRGIQNALGAANESRFDRLASKLPSWLPKWLGGDVVRNAIGRQRPKDLDLLNALRSVGLQARPGAAVPPSPHEAAILASRLYNPRKIMNSLSRGGGKRKLIAALAAAGLLTTGSALRGIDM